MEMMPRQSRNPSIRIRMPGAELAMDVLHFVRERDHVSFVELERRFGARARGHLTMTMASDDNVVLWGGMSDELSRAIQNLTDLHLVELRPASSLLTYVLDGRIPDLPVVDHVPEAGFQEPHWLPTLLCRPSRQEDRRV